MLFFYVKILTWCHNRLKYYLQVTLCHLIERVKDKDMVKSTFQNLNQEKKKRVTDALITEFSSYSLADAQVARIVKSSGIARGAFYKYFDDLTDAYEYVYQLAMKDIHAGLKPSKAFDVELLYKTTADFVGKSEKSPYLALIKLHLSKNEAMLTHDFKQKAVRLKDLDVKTWSAMVLSHETIKLVLFDPDHKNIYLERFKHSLKLLNEEG
ncbi:hypothetical protein HMPREF0525_01016 [Lactobacillus jensenii 27-2-CHN]|nr:hypothetical protein HMPREF0525_01016 [Lactobacillus jensenii 27-2-CHN]EFH30331.1 transcriptional regulator, TetR family [Lactobacillus jensenii JV-V16]